MLKSFSIASVFLLAALIVTSSLSQPVPPQGAWTAKKPLPGPRNEVELTTFGGKLYVVGGNYGAPGGDAVPLLDEYDPATDSWRSLAAMSKGLDHLGVAAIGGKIYTVGGFLGSIHRGAQSDVYEYTIAAN